MVIDKYKANKSENEYCSLKINDLLIGAMYHSMFSVISKEILGK